MKQKHEGVEREVKWKEMSIMGCSCIIMLICHLNLLLQPLIDMCSWMFYNTEASGSCGGNNVCIRGIWFVLICTFNLSPLVVPVPKYTLQWFLIVRDKLAHNTTVFAEKVKIWIWCEHWWLSLRWTSISSQIPLQAYTYLDASFPYSCVYIFKSTGSPLISMRTYKNLQSLMC